MLVGILILFIAIILISFILFVVYHFVSIRHKSDKIGLNYKTGVSPEFDSIVADLQKVVNLMENTMCSEVKAMLTSEMYKIIADGASQVSCDELRKELQTELVEFTDPSIKNLVTNILNNICTGSTMDKDKVEKLVKGTYNSLCYQEW